MNVCAYVDRAVSVKGKREGERDSVCERERVPEMHKHPETKLSAATCLHVCQQQ